MNKKAAAPADDSSKAEENHREFMLAALRSASARLRLMANEVDEIGVALKGDLIVSATAVACLRDANLMWTLNFLPETIRKIDATMQPEVTRGEYVTNQQPTEEKTDALA